MTKFNSTITLFSRRVSEDRIVTWKRTILTACSYTTGKTEVLSGSTRVTTNSTIVRIPSQRYSLGIDFSLEIDDIIYHGESEHIMTDQNRNEFLTKNKSKVFLIKCVSDNSIYKNRVTGHYKAVSV